MKRVHYIDNYLINPQHPVTVNLIGAGGTGSQVLTCLARPVSYTHLDVYKRQPVQHVKDYSW